MVGFFVRRLIFTIPVLIGILIVTFVLVRSIPGDPCRAVLGERATDEICDAYFERYGLNEPVTVQFAIYVRNVLQGDLGNSLVTRLINHDRSIDLFVLADAPTISH